LRKSNEVDQMMKVVGEEGTSIDEFILYLKGQFFDDVYLQQNAFDKVDEATVPDRQKYVYDLIYEIIEQSFTFKNKESARRFFLELRQQFINWNSTEFDSQDFKSIDAQIKEKLESLNSEEKNA